MTDPADAPTPFDLATVDRLLTTTKAVRGRLDLDRPVDEVIVWNRYEPESGAG